MRATQIFSLATSSVLALSPLYLASCAKDADQVLPAAGTIQGQNPAAAAMFAKAEQLEASDKREKAAKTYLSVYKSFPYSTQASDAMFRRAALQQTQGELLAAFETYQTFVTRFPADKKYSIALSEQSKVAHAAADGIIKNNFLGLKTKIDRTRTTGMLEKVISNAPRSDAAPKARFAIGELWERENQTSKAIDAYREVGKEYPNSPYAPEAQFRIGSILIAQSNRGDQDVSNMKAAKRAYQDYLNLYPTGKKAAEVKSQLALLESKDVGNSYEVAEFYEGKGNVESAKFYYKEVIRKAKSGSLHDRAQARLTALGA